MPYNPNANWTARTNAGAQNPVYYVAFEGLSSKHFSTAAVRAAATTKKRLLRVPDSVGQKLSQLQGRASLNLITFELLDRDGEITDLVATEKSSPTLPTLVNRAVTLYSGYADLSESDYGIAGIGQIDAVELMPDGLAYRFSVVDLKRHQFDDVFRNAEASQSIAINTILAADAPVGATSITVVNAADISPSDTLEPLATGDKLYLGPSTDGGYTGQELKVSPHTVTGQIVGLKAPLTKAFKKGDEVRWASTVIEGNPINLIYAVLTGDFANGTFPLTKKRGEPTGLGIAAGSIDSAALRKERDRMVSAEVWRFEIKEPGPGFQFLEQRIYRLLGYPTVTVDGKLSFRLYRPAWPDDAAAGLPSLTKGDIKRWRFKRAHDLHVNRVEIGVDQNAESGEPSQVVTSEDTADQTATKGIVTFKQSDTGFRGELRGVRLAEKTGGVMLRRFRIPPPQIEVWCHLTKRALPMGEVVAVTHDEIPNVKAGTRGLSAVRLEIVEREELFSAAEMRFVLQDAQFTRPIFIGPPGVMTGYDAATAAEREFFYIGPPGTPPGNFDDGSPPYEII